jgi:hypothetical protein
MAGKNSRGLALRIAQARQAATELNKATDDLNQRLSVAEKDLVALGLGVSASVALEIDSGQFVLSLMKHNSQWGLFVSSGSPQGGLENGTGGLTVRASKGPTIRGEVLQRFAERLIDRERDLPLLDPQADTAIMRHVLAVAPFSIDDLRERRRVEAAVPLILARLAEKRPDLSPVSIDLDWDPKTGSARIAITPRSGGTARPVVIDAELVGSVAYQRLYCIEMDVRSIGPAPYFVRYADEPKSHEVLIDDADALLSCIDLRIRKGSGVATDAPTSIVKCSREIRVAAAHKLAGLVEQMIRQVERQKMGVQDSIAAVDAFLGELQGGAS